MFTISVDGTFKDSGAGFFSEDDCLTSAREEFNAMKEHQLEVEEKWTQLPAGTVIRYVGGSGETLYELDEPGKSKHAGKWQTSVNYHNKRGFFSRHPIDMDGKFEVIGYE